MDTTTSQNTQQHETEERETLMLQMCLIELRKERLVNQSQQEHIKALWGYVQQLTSALQEDNNQHGWTAIGHCNNEEINR